MRALLGAFLAALLALPAAAQTWPERPVRLIIPFPPGGGTDVVSRIAAQRLSEALGQPVVAENRGGAGGTIGSEAVARSAPDGYTLGIATSSTHPAAVVLQRGVPYDPVRDFTAVTMLGTTPYILVGGPAAPGTNLREFLAAVQARPGHFNYASVGSTTLGYLLTRQLELLTNTRMGHVPYRGSSQVYPDLLNGTVAVMLDNPTGSAALVRDGKLRAYAVTLPSAALPEVPTFASLGVQGFDAPFWYGIVGPAGMPPAVAERVQQALAQIVATPAGRAEYTSKDVTPVMSRPAVFARTIADDLARWKALAERLGIQPE